MKNSVKKLLYSACIFLLFFIFLFQQDKVQKYAYIGLQTWYENMIITLFPFMVLQNILTMSGYCKEFIKPIAFFLKPIFQISDNAIFCITFGFLCGFPMGAKCVTDMWKANMLSKEEGEYLLAFQNLIGPAYIIGFVHNQILPKEVLPISFWILYGIPLVYGVILRYTIYKNVPVPSNVSIAHKKFIFHTSFFQNTKRKTNQISPYHISPFLCIPDAILAALTSIATLGGYMIFFNALRILCDCMHRIFPFGEMMLQSTLEISGGLLYGRHILSSSTSLMNYSYLLLTFGGLCCYFQTCSLLRGTPFRAKKYMLHKIILCSITFIVLIVCRY